MEMIRSVAQTPSKKFLQGFVIEAGTNLFPQHFRAVPDHVSGLCNEPILT
jgi:hypothetical protein